MYNIIFTSVRNTDTSIRFKHFNAVLDSSAAYLIDDRCESVRKYNI